MQIERAQMFEKLIGVWRGFAALQIDRMETFIFLVRHKRAVNFDRLSGVLAIQLELSDRLDGFFRFRLRNGRKLVQIQAHGTFASYHYDQRDRVRLTLVDVYVHRIYVDWRVV